MRSSARRSARAFKFFSFAVIPLLTFACTEEAEDEFFDDVSGGGLPGACCTDDGCSFATEATCPPETGVFYEDESCGPFSPCRGACCLDMECFISAGKNECEGTGGEFKGAGTFCDGALTCPADEPDDIDVDSDVFAICCEGTACLGVALEECTGTVFFGADNCNDIDCTIGACCDSLIEECEEVSQTECAQSSFSEFAGAGTKCADTNCNLGACCPPDASDCTDTTEDQCEQTGGGFLGLGTSCDVNICRAQPCCKNDGTCSDLVAQACRAGGGAVRPQGSDCSGTPCDLGLCCSLFPSDEPFGDCRDDFQQAGCEGQAGTFAGRGLTCSENTFEEVTSFSITNLANDPPTGIQGQTTFALDATWFGNLTFPVRLQGYIDPDLCPDGMNCPIVSRRVDFRLDDPGDVRVTIPDWNECPGLFLSATYAEPWIFRIVDQHCVTSNEVHLLMQCAP